MTATQVSAVSGSTMALGVGRAAVHLRDQHVAVAESAERRGGPVGRPVHGAGRAVGRARRRWFRRGVADGGMDAQPGGVGDRAGQHGAGRRASRPCCRTTDPQDVVGSPYCVRDYEVDPRLGGRDGLARARAALARHGLGLVLDFVPNHVAPDHPWTRSEPGALRPRAPAKSSRTTRRSFVAIDGSVLARGRDPYFPAWPDVVQLNAFAPALRAAVIDTLRDIAEQCDGVRCDMAMLMMNDVFARTWGARVGAPPAEDYWPTVIPAVREAHPDFRFIAEAYWDLEWALQQQGFDFCYDKRLYDRLVAGRRRADRRHLSADRHVSAEAGPVHREPRRAAGCCGVRRPVGNGPRPWRR